LIDRPREGFMALRMMTDRLAVADIGCVKASPKTTDPAYATPEHRAWALAVKTRARWHCQECGAVGVRLFADHIVELKDGGAALDPANGQALCGRCHTKKTLNVRAKRLGAHAG
jgi:5-methylcytosine-specific restriction protein A